MKKIIAVKRLLNKDITFFIFNKEIRLILEKSLK
jgi:hypothetical protein